MCKDRESFIRRNGFPITQQDAQALLDFINMHNPSHDCIEAEIYVKLELLARKYYLHERK